MDNNEIALALYQDENTWKGWIKEDNKYYFDDLGIDNFSGEMNFLQVWAEVGKMHNPEFSLDETW